MALFKCKMCGGDLEVSEGSAVAECEYCGTKQTVPKATNENLQNLFNRANTLRIKCEFDKAERMYEKIIQSDTTQSEAYWGLILCKYGIEYIDDPTTFKKIPTCHRSSYDAITADDDYKSALEHADFAQRALYEEQAKEIERIQKEILALAQKEETYDVFICYKETDANGQRTQDSVIANDIYYQLTMEGFKVFYAAITLEGKLGSAYEPIIFAALNSAKVMLVIGTKPEYFNAVWVKNEWSRFLKIIKKDRSKLLIPCYRDMDAYELPDEFAHLQAQDMSKIGFINDIERGIKKVLKKDEPKATIVKEVTSTSAPTNIAPLIERTFMFLEDGEWEDADEYSEKVLDIDPKNTKAYIAKLMVDLHVNKQDQLKDCDYPFDDNNNYQKALRFANQDLKTTLTGYIEHIKTRNENARLESIYVDAKFGMFSAAEADLSERQEAYNQVLILLQSIPNYKDSLALAEECFNNAEAARKDYILYTAKMKIAGTDIDECEDALFLLDSIEGWKDADEQVSLCHDRIKYLTEKEEEARIEKEKLEALLKKENEFRQAESLMFSDSISSVLSAIEKLSTMPDYKNARQLIELSFSRVDELKKKESKAGCSIKIAIAAIVFLAVITLIPSLTIITEMPGIFIFFLLLDTSIAWLMIFLPLRKAKKSLIIYDQPIQEALRKAPLDIADRVKTEWKQQEKKSKKRNMIAIISVSIVIFLLIIAAIFAGISSAQQKDRLKKALEKDKFTADFIEDEFGTVADNQGALEIIAEELENRYKNNDLRGALKIISALAKTNCSFQDTYSDDLSTSIAPSQNFLKWIDSTAKKKGKAIPIEAPAGSSVDRTYQVYGYIISIEDGYSGISEIYIYITDYGWYNIDDNITVWDSDDIVIVK